MAVKGQTFTLEGIAASLLLIIATYTIFQSSVVVSPSWSEFNNVQLKQLAYDILRIADNDSSSNSLQAALKNLNVTTNCDPASHPASITCNSTGNADWCCDLSLAAPEFENNLTDVLERFGADARLEIIWLNGSNVNTTVLKPFDHEPTPNAVRASRFIYLGDISANTNLPFYSHASSNFNSNLLVEVRLTLWKV